MRFVYCFVGILLIFFSCRTSDGVQPASRPIRSFADLPTDYSPIQDGAEAAGRLKSEIHNGRLTGEWRYNEQGKLLEWRSYQEGQVTRADQYRYDVGGRLRYVQHFDNECGLASYAPCSGPVKWTSYDEIDTDNAGRIQGGRRFLKQSGQWELRSASTYEYNSQGQPVKVLQSDPAGQSTRTQAFVYDSSGNITSLREISSTATPDLADRTFTYEYDKGLNPYAGTVYFVAPFFSSRHMQHSTGSTYEYEANGYPIRIRQNNVVTELVYY